MRHLTPEQMLDVVEGTRPRTDFPHVDACPECAARLDAISQMMAVAAEVDVPEPSPLFWDHLSGRIRDRVAQDANRGWPTFAWPWRMAIAAAAAAVLVLAVGLALRRGAPPLPDNPAAVADATFEATVTIDEDPALALLADLSADLDWDAASEAGIVPAHGAVDHVLVGLTDEERTELQRILE
jgi:hypothetical protein